MQKVEKVLRALTVKFNHIVATIETSKNMFEMKLEEFQASSEANKLRFKPRNCDKVTQQAQQFKLFKKMRENALNTNQRKGKWKKNKWKDEGDGNNSHIQGETNKNGASHNMKFKKKVDLNEVQCLIN